MSSSKQISSPKSKSWRRRLRNVLILLAVFYGALWGVRWSRDYPTIAPRKFFRDDPLIFAHRGASAAKPEHTYESYQAAIVAGADVLELDVYLTRDQQIVVSHDASLTRTFGLSLAIADHDLSDLRAQVTVLHPGHDGATLLPTLQDVVAWFPGVRLNVEIKAKQPLLPSLLAQQIARLNLEELVLVASFHGKQLQRFREASMGRVATSASPLEAAKFVLCYKFDVPSHPSYQALQIPPQMRRSWPKLALDSRDFIEFVHTHGLKVHYWTVDEPARMKNLLAKGADGIITNKPDVAHEIRKQEVLRKETTFEGRRNQ